MDLQALEENLSFLEVESVEIAAPERPFCRRRHGIFMSLALLGIGSLLTATGHISGTKFLALFQQDNSVCREIFQQEINKGNPIHFAHIEFQDFQDISQGFIVHEKEFANAAEAADILMNRTTNFMEVGDCTPESKTMLWFYPFEDGDHNGAFDLYQYECQRTSDLQNQQECVRLYRVANSYQAIQALNRQAPGSVVDLVLGGHGSDTKNGGSLQLGAYADEAVHWNDAEELFTAMAPKLAPQATVTLDSCHGAINKMAETASRMLPSHWVFAGVVTTTGAVTVEQVPFDGGLEGPTHLPSNPGQFTAVDAQASLHALSMGYSEHEVGYFELPATKASGVALPVAVANLAESDARTLDNYPVSSTKEYSGERLAAFYGGQNRGIVTQWMYPSKNGKVIQKGQKVKVAQPFRAWRSEMAEENGKAVAVIFTNVLPKGLTGTVLNVGATDGTPSAGNAMILFDLPHLESGSTLNSGANLGLHTVLTRDFNKLEATESLK